MALPRAATAAATAAAATAAAASRSPSSSHAAAAATVAAAAASAARSAAPAASAAAAAASSSSSATATTTTTATASLASMSNAAATAAAAASSAATPPAAAAAAAAACARVMVFTGAGEAHEPRELAVPGAAELAAGEVLVGVRLATVCGSDVHTITGARIEPTPGVLGHEGTGVVLSSRRDGLAEGTRVTWSIADGCGECEFCTVLKLPHKCKKVFKYGHALVADGSGLNGSYASHVLLRSGTHIVPVPDAVSDRVVVASNCALATICNMMEQGHKALAGTPIRRVWVQGAGLLGIYGVALASHYHPEATVYCSDSVQSRLDMVKDFGGVGVHTDDIDSVIDDSSVDLVLEVAGAPQCVPTGIKKIRTGGAFILGGLVHPNSSLKEVTGEQLIRKCLTVTGVHNYAPKHLDEAVGFLDDTKEKFPFESLVSPESTSLSELDQAVELAQQRRYHRECVAP